MSDMARDIFDRTWAMVAEWQNAHPAARPRNYGRLAAPFGFVEPPPLKWRVSGDVFADLSTAFDGDLSFWEKRPAVGIVTDLLYGMPIVIDKSLPLNSVVLESRP